LQLATSALPPVSSKNDEDRDLNLSSEIFYRVFAVEGLGNIQKSQLSEDLEKELLSLVQNATQPMIARAAIKIYLKSGSNINTRMDYLKSVLPEKYQKLVRTDVDAPPPGTAKISQ